MTEPGLARLAPNEHALDGLYGVHVTREILVHLGSRAHMAKTSKTWSNSWRRPAMAICLRIETAF